ncbi:sensor histidine kinase [Actinoplanes sp. NPDC049265]|uniref:sensor histidine kinase n=1 Tax=Actinoplanes sp. NPDC049265 TaxID=3363902 RepID=UPI00371898A6
MTGASVLDQLRGLPGRLALWVTLFSAVGCLICAGLLVRSDTRQRELRMDGALSRVTGSVQRVVYEDQDAVVTTDLAKDPLSNSCPEFEVLPGPTTRFASFHSLLDCVQAPPEVTRGLAEAAVTSGQVQSGYETAGDHRIRVYAEPFRFRSGQYAGAVVAVSDPSDELAAHRTFILLLVGGGVLLLGAIGAASFLLAVRAIRPAAGALEQQEALLADTAHDLRTPAAALRALAEAAVANPAERAELLPRTVELARRMGTIVEGVLMRARLAAGVEPMAIEPVWLDQLVAAVVEETPTGDAAVTVTTAPTKVRADAGLIQRAVGNLLENALRHGRVEGKPAVVQVTVAGGRVIVADQGPGIDPAMAKERFDRFASGGGSSGLGLAIVRWVAQSHGGTLRVFNADGGGAIFELSLPTAPD